MNKHAYIIMAHTNYSQLLKLLACLDDSRNDLYLHLDRKFDLSDRQIDELKKSTKQANIILVPRQMVAWGGYSLIKCYTDIIHEVIRTNIRYSYVHLISGLDLPLKNQDYIHSFFSEHDGEEFIDFSEKDWSDANAFRLKYYYPLQDLMGRIRNNSIKNVLFGFQRILVKIQKVANINRLKSLDIKLMGGSNWFSITYDCAYYIDKHASEYKPLFCSAFCADEFYLQSIVGNSAFYEKRHKPTEGDSCHGNMRLIEWIDGAHPKVFSTNDINRIMNTDLLFARKFDELIDEQAIDMIVERIVND